ncbi:hypothetical protein QTP88_001338 [Uroleucon formosanum]
MKEIPKRTPSVHLYSIFRPLIRSTQIQCSELTTEEIFLTVKTFRKEWPNGIKGSDENLESDITMWCRHCSNTPEENRPKMFVDALNFCESTSTRIYVQYLPWSYEKIFKLLGKGFKTYKTSVDVDLINSDLLDLGQYLPSEFSRQPRSLEDIEFWKASESRCFLLYTGPIVLKGRLKKNSILISLFYIVP